MPIVPIPGGCVACGNGGGGGTPPSDVESLILCDVVDGEVVGTALAVYEYDADGNPVGPPTFVIPGTNDPYVAQGTLQACPGEVGCGAPQQFCFTSSETTDAPGRMYDLTFSLGQGFAVTGIGRDLTFAPTNVLWSVNDADGSEFIEDLTAAVQSQFPGATVNIAPGTDNRCVDGTQEFSIHIECLRLDQDPPSLVQLRYNGGRDLVLNPAFNETPPLDPPVNQGNYGFRLLSRQDDPGPFPGNQPANDANCTNIANRGWETNDIGRTFEIWGQDVQNGQATTPTPRGTPVQEITSDGPPPGGRSTIWQTFTVPAAGNFNIRLVHGARDVGEEHIISLSTGDTDDNQVGDIILNVTNPPSVTNSGGPNPWTTFNQVVALAPGTYTLALSSTNPVGGARGGLFTDMRVFVDGPEVTDSFVNDDETCTVEVTGSTTTCEFWAPRCSNGTITHWYNVADGEELTNAAFWAQVPAPQCCTSDGSGDAGDAVLGNLIHTYLVCGQTDTGPRSLSRVVISDQNGAPISEQFVDTNGALVTPSSWQPGACAQEVNVDRTLGPVCYNTVPPGPFAQQGFLGLDPNDNPRLFDLNGTEVPAGGYTIVICSELTQQSHILCDFGNLDVDGNPHQFLRWYIDSPISGIPATQWNFELDGSTDYVVVGPVGLCPAGATGSVAEFVLCDNFTVGPNDVRISFVRKFIQDEDGNVTSVVDLALDGTPYVIQGTVGTCEFTGSQEQAVVLCDATGTQFVRVYVLNETGGVDATNDVDFDGAPFIPTAPVGLCPSASADREVVCWTQTSTGATVHTGTIRHDDNLPAPGWVLFDQNINLVLSTEPGLTFVPCGGTTPTVTVRSQHRLVAAADAAWTPGADVTGTLLSVSYTVLSGTATVLDSNGTSASVPAGLSATWSVDDDPDILTGPTSIDAVGGTTYVVWTERS